MFSPCFFLLLELIASLPALISKVFVANPVLKSTLLLLSLAFYSLFGHGYNQCSQVSLQWG